MSETPPEDAHSADSHGMPFAGYEMSTDPGRLDVDRIHRWLSTDAYWALGRPRETLERAIAGSLNFGVYAPPEGHVPSGADAAAPAGAQVAYARVVTDKATFAWLCDVYVDRAARGRGLGTALVTAVREHLEPFGLRRIALVTADAHEVYGRLGFAPLRDPDMWMACETG